MKVGENIQVNAQVMESQENAQVKVQVMESQVKVQVMVTAAAGELKLGGGAEELTYGLKARPLRRGHVDPQVAVPTRPLHVRTCNIWNGMRPLLASRSQVAFVLRRSCSPASCGWTSGVQVVSRTSLGCWGGGAEDQSQRVPCSWGIQSGPVYSPSDQSLRSHGEAPLAGRKSLHWASRWANQNQV